MSTADHAVAVEPPAQPAVPPFVEGQRLDRCNQSTPGVEVYANTTTFLDNAFWGDELTRHVRRGGALAFIGPDTDGQYRGSMFPGLWLNPTAQLASDHAQLRNGLDRGLAMLKHAASVAHLADA